MQNKRTLLDRVKIDLVNVETNLKNMDDELFVDVAAYHLHQSIEKMMKFHITLTGNDFKRTHDLKILWGHLDDLGKNPPEWIWENSSILNKYQSETRYGEDLVAIRREVKEFLILAKQYYKEVLDLTKIPLTDEDSNYKFSNLFDDI